jgi:hypothetical protein
MIINLPKQSLTQLKKVLKSVLVIFLTVIAINLIKYNNVANAGGGRMPCSIIEYTYECFSVEGSNYLSTAFIKKQQKDNRYYAEKKWELLLSQYLDKNYKEENREKELIKKSLKIKLNDLSKDNLYLSNFLKSYEYNNTWCNFKLSKSLEFLHAIQKHLPKNETAYRLGASRIIFTGNYCFKKNKDKSKWPKHYSLDELYSDFVKVMTPITKIKLSKEQKEVFSVWSNYLMGAISYNDAHDWRQRYNFNLDETSKYFNDFDKIEINEQAIKKYSSWLIQATQYMNMLVKFKQIRSQKKYHLFNKWQLNYDEFVKNFPNSEFNTHLQDMKVGIYNIVGDHDKFIIGYSNTLQIVFDKVYQKQSLNWLDKVNLESPPLILSQKNNFILPENAPKLLKLFQLLTHDQNFLLNSKICKRETSYRSSDFDTDLFFNELCNKLLSISDKNPRSFKNNWYKSQLHYLDMISLIKANRLEQNIDSILLDKESFDKDLLILLSNNLFLEKVKNGSLKNYFEFFYPKISTNFNNLNIEDLFNYQLIIYSKFFANQKIISDLYSSSMNANNKFLLTLPHLEQAILYGDKQNIRSMLNLFDFQKINIVSKIKKINKLKKLKVKLNNNIHNLLIDIQIGDYIYKEKIIPICYQMPPKPTKVSNISQKCGYFSFNKNRVFFIDKKYEDIGLVPIDIFKKSMTSSKFESFNSNFKNNLLQRMIYCMKGYERNFYCIRDRKITKDQVISWFNKINENKIIQKYWYFDDRYKRPNWPHYNNKDKIKQERIFNPL